MPTPVVNRAEHPVVALETTLLVHGLTRQAARPFADELAGIVREHGANPALVGIHAGRAIVGLGPGELDDLLGPDKVTKVNTSNLGLTMHRGLHGATTVSATMELAAAAGVLVFATGGIGGVHREWSSRWDVSADLAALARFPVAVVASGVKSILDLPSTREALETLGIPVVGFGTDEFPAFYRRTSGEPVDARFDDVDELAGFVAAELDRTGHGVLVANPIPVESELAQDEWSQWLSHATERAGTSGGRQATPALLEALHEVSEGRTLRANLALVRANAGLAGRLARALA